MTVYSDYVGDDGMSLHILPSSSTSFFLSLFYQSIMFCLLFETVRWIETRLKIDHRYTNTLMFT